ncbi:MAG: hypothetical protein AAF704_09985, partial [Cyanobacteria bacterium P01_D01_bin.123]
MLIATVSKFGSSKRAVFCIVLSVLSVVFSSSCGDPTARSQSTRDRSVLAHQQQTRLLGIAVAPSSQDYGIALEEAINTGLEVFEIPQQWKDIANNDRDNLALLKFFNSFFPKRSIKVVLSLNPLDTLRNQIPSDLKDLAFDDPEFVRRYEQFADRVLAELPDVELVSLAVGNEVDIL